MKRWCLLCILSSWAEAVALEQPVHNIWSAGEIFPENIPIFTHPDDHRSIGLIICRSHYDKRHREDSMGRPDWYESSIDRTLDHLPPQLPTTWLSAVMVAAPDPYTVGVRP